MGHVRECIWASVGSCKLSLLADAEARGHEDVCMSLGTFSASRETLHGEDV